MSNTAIADRALLCDRYFGALVDRSGFVGGSGLPPSRGDRWSARQCEEIWGHCDTRRLGEGAGAFTQYVRSTALNALIDQPRNVFDRAAGFANDLGLLAGEGGPETGELLSKFRRPSAYRFRHAAWASLRSRATSSFLIMSTVRDQQRGLASRAWAPLGSPVAHARGAGMPSEEGEPADATLVGRLRAGDSDAFAEVVRAWSPMMLQAARAYVSTDASAQEVVQDAWLAMIRGLDKFEADPRCAPGGLPFSQTSAAAEAYGRPAQCHGRHWAPAMPPILRLIRIASVAQKTSGRQPGSLGATTLATYTGGGGTGGRRSPVSLRMVWQSCREQQRTVVALRGRSRRDSPMMFVPFSG